MTDPLMHKTLMADQDPHVRIHNFREVARGYTLDEAMFEAERCLQCKKPLCVAGCPVGVPIPQFIAKVAQGDIPAAYQILSDANALPAISGRVCPQETQCEGKCVRGIRGDSIKIGRLERFVADWAAEHGIENIVTAPRNFHRVAVVGSGPAGLTCAGELARKGYSVTVFEAFHVAGGVLSYGIPEFRLPKSIVKREVANLQKMGVKIELNMVIGKVLTIPELFEIGYEAVFIASGAGLPQFMKIPGESLIGVYSANEYLTRINLMRAYEADSETPILRNRHVAVVGGGNVAMDAARCARRLGAEVHIVYRRGEEELPARREEVLHAKQEGIIFDLLTAPIAIEGDEKGHVNSITCVKMALGEPDASGRRRPEPVPGSEFKVEVDAVIMAIGTSPNPMSTTGTEGLEKTRKGCVAADEDGKTSLEGVYAGGDAATGAATVILAMGAGKSAAKAIDEYIQNKRDSKLSDDPIFQEGYAEGKSAGEKQHWSFVAAAVKNLKALDLGQEQIAKALGLEDTVVAEILAGQR